MHLHVCIYKEHWCIQTLKLCKKGYVGQYLNETIKNRT